MNTLNTDTNSKFDSAVCLLHGMKKLLKLIFRYLQKSRIGYYIHNIGVIKYIKGLNGA